MRGPRALRWAVPVVVLLVGFTAGCAGDHGAPATPSSSVAPSAEPSDVAEVQKAVSAAESALAQADRDAAQDAGDR
ncbi:hypothetical protein [Streptomyces chiangmaiensis]|uniref:DUF4398 domain-containing protein n=1 Tax=Streptomyces chiangmaiensis TaxID=766497 RepID=A0ABU7FGR2_9ACTN|nr:hypothetical protein [Streptomyces chiangmaiensis]MED7822558.1 hypothetical protein [Streptomyces chiangmaiensis]